MSDPILNLENIAQQETTPENLRVRAKVLQSVIVRLRELEELGISQRETGEKLGMGQPSISALLRGDLKQSSLDRLVDIAAYFELDVDLHGTVFAL